MNILVLDVAASESGAVSILKQYYEQAKNDKCNTYYFCLSVIRLEESNNTRILYFPWIKRSWLHRLFFDFVICRQLIHKYRIDRSFSLQNMGIPFCKIPQTIYLQQSLPFARHRFSFFEEKKLWVYQNIISRFIYASLRNADRVIVQANWMKEAVIEKVDINEGIIDVIPPIMNIDTSQQFDFKSYKNRFFYPATGFKYKNHVVIFRAAEILHKKGITDFTIVLTLTEDNLPQECKKIFERYRKNFELIGLIPHESVMAEYCRSVLIFPSYIETVGLPLLEASCCNTPIIAADECFSKEVLKEYEKATFFPWDDERRLAKLIEEHIIAV